MKNLKDTLENVATLIEEVKGLIKNSIGIIRSEWLAFLEECKLFIKNNTFFSFEVGESYTFGWIGDSELKSTIKVTKRTKCFISFIYGGEVVKAKINSYKDSEYVYPSGQY